MRILSRYLLRTHVGPFVFALSALTMVMLLNELSQRFYRLVGKGLHWSVILEVFGLSVPFIVAMTLPMAVLVAVLYAFNRLAGDNEITAMQANGVPLPRLMAPVLVASLVLAGGLVWFNNTVLPDSNHRLQILLSSISRKKPSFALQERTINEILDKELYLQAARIDRQSSDLEDVVIYDERERGRSRTIYADSGRMAFNEDQTDLYLTLYEGVSQERKEGEPQQFQRVHFQKMVMRVPDVSNRLNREGMDRYRSDREMPISQMRKEVEGARNRYRTLSEESRAFAVALTRRLTGLDTDVDDPVSFPGAPRGASPDEEVDRGAGSAGEGGSPGADEDTSGGRDAAPGDGASGERAPRREGADAAARMGGASDAVRLASAKGGVRQGAQEAAGAGASAGRTPAGDSVPQEAAAAGGGGQPGGAGASDTAAGDTAGAAGPGTEDTAAGPGADDTAADDSAARDSALAGARERGTSASRRIRSLASAPARLESYGRRASGARKRANRFAVEIHKKYSIPAACIVFVLIGAPVAVRYREGGVAMVVAVSLLVFCAYYVSLVAGEELADNLILSPFWAMWAPNVLFGALGLGLTIREVRVG